MYMKALFEFQGRAKQNKMKRVFLSSFFKVEEVN